MAKWVWAYRAPAKSQIGIQSGRSPPAHSDRKEDNVDSSTLLIIILIVLLVGGGGWYGRGRWY